MDILTTISGYIASDIRMATPILFAALGLLLLNCSGIRFIGVEGVMLMAALTAVFGSYITGNVWLGFCLAIIVGGVMGALYAFLTVSLRANQTVIGQAFNLISIGISSTLFRTVFGKTTLTPKVDTFQNLNLPLLSEIPILGSTLFNHMLPVYFAFLLVPIISFILLKTPIGLNLRSVGEKPEVSDTLGIDVYKTRYISTIIGCMLMAMGGAFLSTGLLRFFSEGMVSGRGFIAVAAVVFGKHKPKGILIATLLFGAGSVAANVLQTLGTGIDYNIPVMIPYLLTIIVLAGFTGKVYPPAALGKPYKKG